MVDGLRFKVRVNVFFWFKGEGIGVRYFIFIAQFHNLHISRPHAHLMYIYHAHFLSLVHIFSTCFFCLVAD